jgi:hypothetical protein
MVATNVLCVTNSQVGIGTNAPGYVFHVVSRAGETPHFLRKGVPEGILVSLHDYDMALGTSTVQNAISGGLIVGKLLSGVANQFGLYCAPNANLYLNTAGGKIIGFYVNEAQKVWIKGTGVGQLGIGVTPSYALDVMGFVQSSNIYGRTAGPGSYVTNFTVYSTNFSGNAYNVTNIQGGGVKVSNTWSAARCVLGSDDGVTFGWRQPGL